MSKALRSRLAALFAAIAALALIAPGCGDDDDDGEGGDGEGGPTQVDVTAGEYFFELSDTPDSTGPVTVTMTNEGGEPHALILARVNEGFTLDEAFEAEGEKGTAETLGQLGAGPGQEAKDEISANLTPGHYAMVCPIETKGVSHYEEGQSVEFDVE
jgi:hypothetical protein